MSEAVFHVGLLSNYQLVTKPGTYYVSTAYTVTESNLTLGDFPRYIVPLRALTGDGLVELIEILNSQSSVPFSDVRHVFLSGALWYGEGDTYEEKDLPIKGEKVLATFDFVERDGIKRLLCTHLELLPREELDYVDIDQLDQFRLAITNLITKA